MNFIDRLLELNVSYILWLYLAAAIFLAYKLATLPRVKPEEFISDAPVLKPGTLRKLDFVTNLCSPIVLWALAFAALCINQIYVWRYDQEAFNNYIKLNQDLYLWLHGVNSEVAMAPLLYVLALIIFLLGTALTSNIIKIINAYFYERIWSDSPDLNKALLIGSNIIEKRLSLSPISVPKFAQLAALALIIILLIMLQLNVDWDYIYSIFFLLIATIIFGQIKYWSPVKKRTELLRDEGPKFIIIEKYKTFLQRLLYQSLLWNLVYLAGLSLFLILPYYYVFTQDGILSRGPMKDSFIPWQQVDEISFRFNIRKPELKPGEAIQKKDQLQFSMLLKIGDTPQELNFLDVLEVVDNSQDVVHLAKDAKVKVLAIESAGEERKLLDEILNQESDKPSDLRRKLKFEKYMKILHNFK